MPAIKPPECSRFDTGNLFDFVMRFDAGDVMPLHKHHNYAHRLLQVEGETIVELEETEQHLTNMASLWVPAGMLHAIRAIRPSIILCTHVCRFSDGREFPFEYEPGPHAYDEAVEGV